MKTTKKIISSVLAVLVVVSAMAIGGFSASAATLSAPKNFTVTNANHSFVLKWGKVSGAKQYQIYKGSKLMETVSKTSTRDYSLTGGQTYSYKVRAINGTKKGTFSKVVKATRLNPSIITSVENKRTGIEIKWAMRTGADKYIVERKTTGDFAPITSTPELSYLDTTAVPGTDYGYRITCYNNSTKSTSVVSVVVHIVRLVPVTGIKAVKAVNPQTRQITVSWTGSTGADSYNIYRQKATDEDFIRVANVISTNTSFVDTDIISNPSAYRYYVTAVKDTSESVKSAERVVQTYGTTPAYFDDEVNYHVPLKFKVGDVYAEGKALSEYFSYDGSYDVNILNGNDVIKIENNVITALKAGTAQVQIKVTDDVKAMVDTLINDSLVTRLTNRYVVLEITVE